MGAQPRLPRRWLLHLALLLATLYTTTVVGAQLAHAFNGNHPAYQGDWLSTREEWLSLAYLVQGLPFSLSLLAILLAHEFGHYWACVYYGVEASLPYFLPAPTLIGTLGAFIRIRSAILSRRALFDIGIAGPLAGCVVLLPLLVAGVAASKVLPGVALQGDVIFGTPLLLQGIQKLFFPGVGSNDILLHPVARAAWVGLTATALNLLPVGQLDGGHIVYALTRRRHRLVTLLCIAALLPLGLVYWPWWLWAAFLFFFGRRHPMVFDHAKLGTGRKWLGALAAVILLASFMAVPVTLAR